MGAYISRLLFPPAASPDVHIDSQNDVNCCTTTNVTVEESDDESIHWYNKR
jgi:hypothetical protein